MSKAAPTGRHVFSLAGRLVAVIAAGRLPEAPIRVEHVEAPAADIRSVYASSGLTLIATVEFSAGGGVLRAWPELAPARPTVNGAPTGGDKTPIELLDSIRIGDLRIEVLQRGAPALRCINRQCERLNAYVPEKNCRWCGFKLAEAVTTLGR